MKKTLETILGFIFAIMFVCVFAYGATNIYNSSIAEINGHRIFFHQMLAVLVLLWICGAVIAHSFATVFLSKITTFFQDIMSLTQQQQPPPPDTTNNNP